MNWTNLFSGIIGAIVGALIGSFITVFIYWYSQYIASRRKLLDKLTILRYDVWHSCRIESTDSTKMWDNSIKDIWPHYNAVTDWILSGKERAYK